MITRLTAAERAEVIAESGVEPAKASGRATIDVKPLAKLLGVDDNTIYRAIAAGRLPAIRLSPRRVVVPMSVVERLLAGEQVAR